MTTDQHEKPMQYDFEDHPIGERTVAKWPLFNDSSYVYILGLFSKQENPMSPSSEERAMFMSAIILSQRYNITIDGKQFAYHVEETNERDAIGALDRTCLSITQNQILGIVGPTGSTEVKTIARFCNRIGLPVFGHSATDPGLSDRNAFKTFYRMTASDIVLAKALLKLFQKYSWNSTNIIYQDDNFGKGGLQALTEIFGTEIKISSRIKYDIFTDQIKDLRQQLKESSSRIVLLWATANITTRIIQLALELGGVLAPNFLWIMTGTNSQMHFHDKQLTGMLFIRPVSPQAFDAPINKTLLNDVIEIWKTYDLQSYTGDDNHINAYALYTFDSAWLLISVLSKLCQEEPSNCPILVNTSNCFSSSLTNQNKLHDIIRTTEFLGVSGHVKFNQNTTDRLVQDNSHFMIDNLQPSKSKSSLLHPVEVLKFSGSTSNRHCKTNTQWIDMDNSIVWPRSSDESPLDYALATKETLNITVYISPPFYMEKPRKYSNGTSGIEPEGYIYDLILLLEKRMNFIKNITIASMETSYNELIDCVQNGTYDIVMADLTQTASRLDKVDFSVSIYNNAMRLVTRKSKKMKTPIMAFLKPFHYSLWLGVLGIYLVSTTITAIVEYIGGKRKIAHVNKTDPTRQLGTTGAVTSTTNESYVGDIYHKSKIITFVKAMYQSIGNLVQRDSELRASTVFAHCQTVIVWLISVVLIALFTSNMVQYFTSEREKSWIQSIEDLKMCGTIGCDRIGIVERSQHADYFKREVTNNIDMNYYHLKNTTECYTKLLDYYIDVAIADSSSADYHTQTEYCDLEVAGLPFGKTEFGIAVPKGWTYKKHLDETLLELKEDGSIEKLLNKWFQKKNCDGENEAKNNPFGDGLTLAGTQGLFIVFTVLTTINILAFMFQELWILRTKEEPSHEIPKTVDPSIGTKLEEPTKENPRRRDSSTTTQEPDVEEENYETKL